MFFFYNLSCWVLSQCWLLGFITIWDLEFCTSLNLWVLSPFELFIVVTNQNFEFCHNFSFWALYKFQYLSFFKIEFLSIATIIEFFELCQYFSFWVLSQFEFLCFVTIYVFLSFFCFFFFIIYVLECNFFLLFFSSLFWVLTQSGLFIYCQNLSYWVLSHFEILSYVIFLFSIFFNILSQFEFWVSSQAYWRHRF